MESLADELSEHMDESERTIQGAFCSLINWGTKTVERTPHQKRHEVVNACRRWWHDHRPGATPDVWLIHSKQSLIAWTQLGACIAVLLDIVEVVEKKHEGV